MKDSAPILNQAALDSLAESFLRMVKDRHGRGEVSDRFSELLIYTAIKTLARHTIFWSRRLLADSEAKLFILRIIEQDREIRHLGRAVKDALRETSPERILTLEEVVNGQAETLVGRLSGRWKSKE